MSGLDRYPHAKSNQSAGRGLFTSGNDDLGLEILIVMVILFVGVIVFPNPNDSKDLSSKDGNASESSNGISQFLGSQSTSSKTSKQISKSHSRQIATRDIEGDYLDRQMQDAAKKAELGAQRIAIDNRRFAPALDSREIPNFQGGIISEDQSFVSEVPEDNSTKVYRDMAAEKKYDTRFNPISRMDSIMERKRYLNEYDRRQREEYVRQVIENAERDGYSLSINNQLEIVAVRPTSKERPMHLAPRTVEPSVNYPDPFAPGNSGSH